jgi:hypothetical protein
VATTTASKSKYNAVLAAITTSSPKDEATPIQTTTTHFPNIPDFDTPYPRTLQDSKVRSNSKQASSSAANTSSQQTNSQLPKSRRITSTTAFSLDEPFSTAVFKPTQAPRSRGSSHQISLESSAQPPIGRRGPKVITYSAPLSDSSGSDSHIPSSSSSQGSNTRRTTTKHFTVADNKNSTSKAVSFDAEISTIEDSFTQNNISPRRGKGRGSDSSRTDLKALSRLQNQNQRGVSEAVPRTRLVSEPTPTPSSNSPASDELPSSKSSAARLRIPQSRQPENIAPRSTVDPVTPHTVTESISSETVSLPSIQISSASQSDEAKNEPSQTPSPPTSRSYHARLVETDDVNSGLSRNSVVQQTDVSTSNRARSRGSSQRKPTACADGVDTNSNAGCNEKLQIRYNLVKFLPGKVL